MFIGPIEGACCDYNARIQTGDVASVWHLVNMAGQPPNCDLVPFCCHLGELSEHGAYSSLLDNNTPTSLDLNFPMN